MKLSRLVWRVRREIHRFNRSERRLWHKKSILVNRFLNQYWRDVAELVGATCEPLGGGFRRLSIGSRWTIANAGNVMLDSSVALRVAGNKVLMYRLMRDWGVTNLPRHCICTPGNMAAATEMLQMGTLVTKPAAGTGAGRGITTRITTREDLRRGVSIASRFDDTILVEEYIESNCYRLLYLDGQLLDAIWRRSPSVTGDGSSTIDDLVDRENHLRENADELRSLCFITKNNEHDNQLRHLGYDRRSVPASGEKVTIKSVVNQNNATENERVFDRVHVSIIEKCAEICNKAKLQFVGVDLMAADISQAWSEQNIYINELNTTPGLHHHVLTSTGSENHRVGTRLLLHLLK